MTPYRKFLFLQGPHGPFFRQLAAKIALTGAEVCRIGFNRGDAVFWGGKSGFTLFNGQPEDRADFLETYLDSLGITDIVLYGDSRPLHAKARLIAKQRGLTIHCFEEGYLRPYWATYERGGASGHSALMNMNMDEIRRVMGEESSELAQVPAQWGSTWHHAYYGFLHHFLLTIPGMRFRHYRPHRQVSVVTELWFSIRKLVSMPLHGLHRMMRTRRLLRDGAIYHLVLLQLSHDASLREHSNFNSVEEFINEVVAEFTKGAPSHHKLIFKTHPFEDGREPLPKIVRQTALRAGITDRVSYIPGGKLGPLLDGANSTVTVNSTVAQQALWRNLPVYALGSSVFSKPELISDQTLAAYLAMPDAPDAGAYSCYRRFPLETSQISGGYYTQRGRAELLRRLVDLMLAKDDPYVAVMNADVPPRKNLKLMPVGVGVTT